MNAAVKESSKRGLIATGGMLGAVLASSCCIGPLALLTLGVSGAWIGNLAALAPYQPLFLAATAGFLGWGFWTVYRKPKVVCEEGGYCASPTSDRVLKVALWAALSLALAAIGVDLFASWLV